MHSQHYSISLKKILVFIDLGRVDWESAQILVHTHTVLVEEKRLNKANSKIHNTFILSMLKYIV
jgi:hypothetical protein